MHNNTDRSDECPFHQVGLKNIPKFRRPAIIMDIDGTLCDTSAALPKLFLPDGKKDFHAFHTATVDAPVNQAAVDFCLTHYNRGRTILIVTARMAEWYDLTQNWLHHHAPCPYDGPFMRQQDDMRPDVQIKREIFSYLSRTYEIKAAMDDNPKVVSLWKELGIPEVELMPGWRDEPQVIEEANRIPDATRA